MKNLKPSFFLESGDRAEKLPALATPLGGNFVFVAEKNILTTHGNPQATYIFKGALLITYNS